ncbi:MAG: hypothetical protein K2K96_09645 [Lachnospiraceae bacterium]|nr:hypothetical protein [Lachnospiraceae bacterium]
MRERLYALLVNRQEGIAQRYHRVHDGRMGIGRFLSYFYLLWLNVAYYLLFCRWLGTPLAAPFYEEKRLPVKTPENMLVRHPLPEHLAEELMKYDIISFDIFDTLVFRPFSEPTDLFYIVGQKLGYLDFKRIRMEAEYCARGRKFDRCGSFEVNLSEIWEQLEGMTGLDRTVGMQVETEAELSLCYANPYMRQVYRKLRECGRRIVITSDMYLTEQVLDQLLQRCGYEGYEKIFVSCEEQKSKRSGKLFDYVRKYYLQKSQETERLRQGDRKKRGGLTFAHVGDNRHSDFKMAKQHGFTAFLYPNINQNTLLYRCYDMSPVIGGAYRGLVNNRLYSGLCRDSRNREYGYVYGGLFVTGYCSFIHRYCRTHGIEKILFLSRDGEILKKAYDLLYPEEETAYVYWSRLAAAKLSAGYMKYDYLRKMIDHKVGQNVSLEDILKDMELEDLLCNLTDFVPEYLREGYYREFALEIDEADARKKERLEKQRQENRERKIVNRRKNWKPMKPEDKLTYANAREFADFICSNWETVLRLYQIQREAAGVWYREVIGRSQSVAAVDIGWAGSGAAALKVLFEKEWKIPCQVTGIVAGTNTIHNAEPYMSETMLQDGSLVSYLYSAAENRDLWKKHNPAQMYNVYFELLTSSEQPSFQGFYFNKAGEVELKFQKPESNPEGIREIQEGILAFVGDYKQHFEAYPYMLHISGRDAYAPMLLAAGFRERYLKKINKEFDLTIGITEN